MNLVTTINVPVPHPNDGSPKNVKFFDIEFYYDQIGKIATLHSVPEHAIPNLTKMFSNILNPTTLETVDLNFSVN